MEPNFWRLMLGKIPASRLPETIKYATKRGMAEKMPLPMLQHMLDHLSNPAMAESCTSCNLPKASTLAALENHSQEEKKPKKQDKRITRIERHDIALQPAFGFFKEDNIYWKGDKPGSSKETESQESERKDGDDDELEDKEKRSDDKECKEKTNNESDVMHEEELYEWMKALINGQIGDIVNEIESNGQRTEEDVVLWHGVRARDIDCQHEGWEVKPEFRSPS